MCLKMNELETNIWRIQLTIQQCKSRKKELILSIFLFIQFYQDCCLSCIMVPLCFFDSTLTSHRNTQILTSCDEVFHRKIILRTGKVFSVPMEFFHCIKRWIIIEHFQDKHTAGKGKRIRLIPYERCSAKESSVHYNEIHFPYVTPIMQRNN
jgi:hypothetical protein